MILSDSLPEKQILFNLNKIMTQAKSQESLKTGIISKDSLKSKNPNDLDILPNSKDISFPNMASNEKPNSDNLETVKSEKNEKSLNINNTLSERIPINNNIKII